MTDNWIAPAFTEANPSPVPWTQEELFSYLRTGVGRLHGAATAATMTPVIRDGLGLPVVPDTDVRAIALYFSYLDHARARPLRIGPAVREAMETSSLGSGHEYDSDANLYGAACLSCHYNTDTVPLAARPELALNSALTPREPTNFIQPVLRGMGFVWFWLVAGILAAYVVPDGFDLGVGILYLLLPRTEEHRRTMINSIGPVWDGNRSG